MPREILSQGVLHEQGKLIIYGRKKIGKTVLSRQLFFSLIHGMPWLGFEVPPVGVSVLAVQVEVAEGLMLKRDKKQWSEFRNIAASKPLASSWVWNTRNLKLDRPECINQLAKYIEEFRPEVLFLDPMYKLISRPGDHDTVLLFQDNLDMLIDSYGISVILIAHPRKPPAQNANPDAEGSDDLFGPGMYTWWADTTIKISRRPDTPVDHAYLRVEDARNAEEEIEAKYIALNRKTLMFEVTVKL